jgi:hypothetical protein
MKQTRCKFKCESVTDHGTSKSVLLTPVYSSDPNSENKAFWQATPSGSLNLTWVNKNVEFMPGKEYYIDITQAG